MSFNSFRDRLETASGFQSIQFREFEFLLGYKRAELLRFHPEGTPAYQRLVNRLNEPSLVDSFYDFLEQRGVAISAALRERNPTLPTEPNEIGSQRSRSERPRWRAPRLGRLAPRGANQRRNARAALTSRPTRR
jgi:tryptophan 2,3-dioxygenase